MSERIGDALRATPAIAGVVEAVAEGERGWVVGGAIRDALLGRPVVDLDLAVTGDEEAIGKRLADAAGGFAFELSAEFGSWRALARDRSWHVDVSRLRGG